MIVSLIIRAMTVHTSDLLESMSSLSPAQGEGVTGGRDRHPVRSVGVHRSGVHNLGGGYDYSPGSVNRAAL